MNFEAFPKIPRLSKTLCTITEKLDGTNAQICFTEDLTLFVGSRNRWITPEDDNYGFARWAHENIEDLRKLGPGRHFGEWYGNGIQRNYRLTEKRFALFNTFRWRDGRQERPACVGVVPILYEGEYNLSEVLSQIRRLREQGSVAVPGFMKPEGVTIFFAGAYYKALCENDDKHKSEVSNA